ncbi:MAG TPA: transporter substrate-binding domain-containing protein [Vicinamibacterales bacterium]|jgi:membrane-bound lytic murein transglycosylase MltF|nr:transporter substrate-binding domain-containing protein [Vicinamibacterales bacterium]
MRETNISRLTSFAFLAFGMTLLAACSRGSGTAPPTQGSAPASPAAASAPAPGSTDAASEPRHELVLPEEFKGLIEKPFAGDLDGLVSRRIIRAGVPFNRTSYFIDKGTPRGLSYEYLVLFEEQLNKQLKTAPALRVHVVAVPMPRDALFPSLITGKLDLVVAQLTVTPERQAVVDFSQPTRRNIDEIVVSAPGAAAIDSPEALSGREVFVRKTSSYYVSLQDLNRRLAAAGKPPVDIRTVSESLEDDDLLEMVNAGLLPATVVDSYLADFWKQVFPDMVIHHDVKLRTNGVLAVAFRKNSPQLAKVLNDFIARNGLDSTIGAVLSKKYLQSTRYVRDATSEAERRKFQQLVALFRKYGREYDFDYLLMAAQGYQESRLDQGAKSSVGAIGVMQLMPETGKEQKVGDIRKVEPNVHAGVKYMRFIRSQFFDAAPMDDLNKALFTFAAYNAGPGRVRALRNEAAQRGLNPNIWFGNVERIASERIGRETVTYVSNIYKYYLAYKLLTAEANRKAAAKPTVIRH